MAKQNEQQALNERAKAINAQISIAGGYDVTLNDGTHYRVTTRAELYELIKSLETQTAGMVMIEKEGYAVGDRVKKTSDDYVVRGTIIGVYYKTSGVCRYSLEEDNSKLIHIYNAGNLESMTLTDEIKSYLIGLIS